jgi:hypothetical protein
MRNTALAALTLFTASCVASETFQREYSAKAITLKIVEEGADLPVEGVIATANWELEMGSLAGGARVMGQMKVLETVSGADGIIRFPAWGPEPNRHGGHLVYRDPQIFLYKAGYWPKRLNSLNKYGEFDYSRDALRVSRWDGSTIRLVSVSSGSKPRGQGTDASLSGVESGLNFAFDGSSCEWRQIPRMTAALVREKRFGRERLNEDRCGRARLD